MNLLPFLPNWLFTSIKRVYKSFVKIEKFHKGEKQELFL